ncbi:MAG: hypothetical protein MSS66_11240 [Selenomonadaceae bacterium]|nr:hypothetical protein [Selenomonadaceae bacterium]
MAEKVARKTTKEKYAEKQKKLQGLLDKREKINNDISMCRKELTALENKLNDENRRKLDEIMASKNKSLEDVIKMIENSD